MSFFSAILDIGKAAIGLFSGASIAGALVRTAVTAIAVNQVNRKVKKANDAIRNQIEAARTTNDTTGAAATPVRRAGVKLQVRPDQNNRIPILYGRAHVSGIISDAYLSTNRQVLTLVFTLCEVTGTKISDNLASVFTMHDCYVNDQLVVWKADGVTVDYTLDRDGNQDVSQRGLMTIRFYAGNTTSAKQIAPVGETITAIDAWTLVEGGSSLYQMSDLVFAAVQITYNQDKGMTTIPTIMVDLQNSMTQPGDCLYDYATNTRYGAGIAESEIYKE